MAEAGAPPLGASQLALATALLEDTRCKKFECEAASFKAVWFAPPLAADEIAAAFKYLLDTTHVYVNLNHCRWARPVLGPCVALQLFAMCCAAESASDALAALDTVLAERFAKGRRPAAGASDQASWRRASALVRELTDSFQLGPKNAAFAG